MTLEQIGGISLILGLISILAGSFVGPPSQYQEPDSGTRLAIIETHATRWVARSSFYSPWLLGL